MAGLFGRLFGKKEKAEQAKAKETKPAKTKREAYFLTADDAKTFGDIEYMRKGLTQNPKAAVNENKPKFQQPAQNQKVETERRRADKSLDLFRNMAREIKKP